MTVPDAEHLHVMLDPKHAEVAIRSDPDAFEQLWWGEKMAGVRVTVTAAKRRLLDPLVREAWRHKAPKKLVSLLDESTDSD